MEHSPAAEQGKDKVITMIKKGLIIAVVLFLISSFFIESVYYGDCLVQEFKFTESMETLPVAEINTFNPNDSDGIYLVSCITIPNRGKSIQASGFTAPMILIRSGTWSMSLHETAARPLCCAAQKGKGREPSLKERLMPDMTAV